MFGKQGKEIQNTGVNSKGNQYTAYKDGGYAYKNYDQGKNLNLGMLFHLF
jgi:hypothetical protein